MQLLAILFALWCACSCRITSAYKNKTQQAEEVLDFNIIDENGTVYSIAGYIDGYLDQKLDHFNSSDNRQWKQRYHVNSYYYENGGPVFLIIGGQREIAIGSMVYGHFIITEYAREFGALCFMLEHRFYGKSQPTNDTSVENLKYLTVHQAMADIENFIAFVQTDYKIPPSSKYVTFGEHYSGSLAAWTRMNRPELVHAAVSSSGIFGIKKEYREYYEIIKLSMDKYKSECTNQVKQAVRIMNTLYTSVFGADVLQKKMKLCHPLNITDKRQENQFFASMSNELAFAALQNDLSSFNIKFVCDIMTKESKVLAFDRFAEVNAQFLAMKNLNCRELNLNKTVNWLKSTSWKDPAVYNGIRQWWHQRCLEIGLFETCSFENDLFGENIPLEHFESMCTETFGNSYNFTNLEKNVNNLNKLNVKLTKSRIVNVQGSVDPWHAAGLLEDSYAYVNTVFVQGMSHAADVVSSRLLNSKQLAEAQEKIKNYLREWLK